MRFFIAFIISLLTYLLFTWVYWTQFSKIEVPPKKVNSHVIKIDIREIIVPKVVAKKVEPIALVTPIVPVPPVVKKREVKRVKKKPKKILKKKKKKLVAKKRLKKKKIIKKKPVKKKVIKPKPKPKVVIKEREIERVQPAEEVIYMDDAFLTQPFEIIEEPIKKVKTPQPSQSSDALASFLGTPDRSVQTNKSHPNSKIKKLYGASFHSFTATQKKFIENNLDTIQQITQSTLTRRGYPEGAGRTAQEGTNIVSFNLHPNGDISNLCLKQRIGYRALDENTLSLIRTAYKDYPYPSTTTKIIFYVTYSIYGY